jgi:hypothetical protein
MGPSSEVLVVKVFLKRAMMGTRQACLDFKAKISDLQGALRGVGDDLDCRLVLDLCCCSHHQCPPGHPVEVSTASRAQNRPENPTHRTPKVITSSAQPDSG